MQRLTGVVSILAAMCMPAASAGSVCPQGFVEKVAEVDTATGTLAGVVLDEECGYVVRYANVVLVGTRIGGTADQDGRFKITGIPPGFYTARAMVMGYVPFSIDGVLITAAGITEVEFRLLPTGLLSEQAKSHPAEIALDCLLHLCPMETVLVPVAYGLVLFNPEYEKVRQREFPNAEPNAEGGGAMGPGSPAKAWVPRCRKCISARNASLSGSDLLERETRRRSGRESWQMGEVSFSTPPALTCRTDTLRCSLEFELQADDLAVVAYLGPRNFRPVFRAGESRTRTGIIVSRAYVMLKIDRDEGSTSVSTSFMLPVGGDYFVIKVSLAEGADLEDALEVIESISFPIE